MKTVRPEISAAAMRALAERKTLWRFLAALCRAVESKGGKTYLVGGYVRDIVEGLPGKDVDLMVSGTRFDRLGAALRSLPAARLGIRRIFPVGKTFPVYKVRTSWAEDDIDVALARTERSTGTGHREFEVRTDGVPALEDASRRDFTINSLMIALRIERRRLEGEVLDGFGGLRDLTLRRIRGVGVPETRFREDPLRMLRAIRQKNERRGYAIERVTRDAIVRVAPELFRTISGERVIGELLRSLKANPAGTVTDLRRTGILALLFPEIGEWGKGASARMNRRYAILARDLGVPLPETLLLANLLVDCALAESKGTASLLGRGRYALTRTEGVARRLHFPGLRRVVRMLSDLTRLCDFGVMRHRLAGIESVFSRGEDPKFLLSLYSAACRAAGRKETDFRPILAAAERIPPFLTGRSLIALGIPAGPRIEEILRDVREATLDGRIANRSEAARLALKIHEGARKTPGSSDGSTPLP
jgi:tRNA nucleotidyltransferase/poly(A) polymerase